MAGSYRTFMKLLEKWPVDTSRKGRDVGEYIREQIKVAFSAGEALQGDDEKCRNAAESLKRLSGNHYGKLYKRTSQSSSTGLSAEECRGILSSDFMEFVKEEQKGSMLSTQADVIATEEILHVPVMVHEVLDALEPKNGQVFIDMTFGAGGHSRRILERAPEIKLLCLDRDPLAHSLAKELELEYPKQVVPLLGRFSELPDLLKVHGVRQCSVDGILFDFGCSSMQFDVAERGFSISKKGPLDMRMDGLRCPDEPTAADILARADEHELAKVFKVYGEEKQAKKIARAIIEARYTFKKLETTQELADLVMTVSDNEYRLDKLSRPSHSATKIFQALRILVNNEVNEINYGMILAHAYLKFGGRVATLTFHSLEDRIVKRQLTGNVIENAINPLPLKYTNHSLCYGKEEVEALFESNWKLLHKHVLTPSHEEVESNARSRSAKFRAAMKIR